MKDALVFAPFIGGFSYKCQEALYIERAHCKNKRRSVYIALAGDDFRKGCLVECRLKVGETGYVAATNLFIVGADAYLHPGTIFFDTEANAHVEGQINWDEEVLAIRRVESDTFYCQAPKPGTKLQYAHPWVHRKGLRVLMVNDEGIPYADVPSMYYP